MMLVSCPKCSTPFHIICLSKHFFGPTQSHYIIPIDGTCPSCSKSFLWGEIIQHKYSHRPCTSRTAVLPNDQTESDDDNVFVWYFSVIPQLNEVDTGDLSFLFLFACFSLKNKSFISFFLKYARENQECNNKFFSAMKSIGIQPEKSLHVISSWKDLTRGTTRRHLHFFTSTKTSSYALR